MSTSLVRLPVQFDPASAIETLADRLERLELELKNTTLLHRKDVMQRYGITPSTLHRRLRAGRLPPPIRLGGPLWRLSDLEAMERGLAPASEVRLKQGGNDGVRPSRCPTWCPVHCPVISMPLRPL